MVVIRNLYQKERLLQHDKYRSNCLINIFFLIDLQLNSKGQHSSSISDMLRHSHIAQNTCQPIANSDKLIIESQFKASIQGGFQEYVFAKLYEKKITIEIKNQQIHEKNTIQFSFDLCFQMIKSKKNNAENHRNQTYYGIRLDIGEDYLELVYPKEKNHLIIWYHHLKLNLNERGFHEQFRATKLLGQGSFAKVFKVENMQNHKLYAAKAFSKAEVYESKENKKALINEIEVLRNFKHQNIMNLFGVYETKNSIYIVIELLGESLYQQVKNLHTFSLNELRTVMKSILKGLVVMHAQGFMHRDIKPENIMYRQENKECVIADFGLTENIKSKDILYIRCGTPGYVAPQIIDTEERQITYDCKCDIFSLGVLFHVLLLKKAPFPGTKVDEVMKHNKKCNINFSLPIYKKLSPFEINLLAKMLQKDPSNRISAEQALLHAFFYQDPLISELDQVLQNRQIVKPKKEPKVKKPKKLVKASDQTKFNEYIPSTGNEKQNNTEFKTKIGITPLKQQSQDFEGINSPSINRNPFQQVPPTNSMFAEAQFLWII